MNLSVKILLAMVLFVNFLNAKSFTVFTEEMEPYNYEKDGKIVGYSTKLLEKILEMSGYSINYKDSYIGFWSRGYNEVQANPDVILYSAARTKEREELFSWVGPIDNMQIGVVAKKSKNIKIKDINELKNYTVGVIRDGAAENLLLEAGVGFEHMDRYSDMRAQVKKLKEDRIDALVFCIRSIDDIQDDLQIDKSEYEIVYMLKEVELYFAFNKNVDKVLIEELNNNLKNILNK